MSLRYLLLVLAIGMAVANAALQLRHKCDSGWSEALPYFELLLEVYRDGANLVPLSVHAGVFTNIQCWSSSKQS